MKDRKDRNGFVSAQILGIMVLATVAGTYLLRSASKEAGTSGSYLKMRTAVSAAQAGLSDGVAQLEADTTKAMGMLRAYLKDDSKDWLLGTSGVTASPNELALSGTGQTYSARILGFDPATGIIKIQAEGKGLGGSSAKITGVYRLEGLSEDPPPATTLHALYLAGDNRDIEGPISIKGPTYFGGAAHFWPTSSGSEFEGTVHFAPSASGSRTVFDATKKQSKPWFTDFDGMSLFETGYYTHGSYDERFEVAVGFQENVQIDGPMWVNAGPTTTYVNANFSGSSRYDVNGFAIVHSGKLNTSMLANPGSIKNAGADIDLSAKVGIPSGPESPVTVDLSAIPANRIFTPAQLGLPANVTGRVVADAYDSRTSAQRFGKFLVIDVATPLNFVKSGVAAENSCDKAVIFLVHSTINANASLPEISSGGNWMFYVPSGGAVNEFGGGNNDFRGYVHATGTGSVSYDWTGGGSMRGAVHHVSAQSGWKLLTNAWFCLTLDKAVLQDYADLGMIKMPSGVAAPAGVLTLTDAKIRPKLLSLYY